MYQRQLFDIHPEIFQTKSAISKNKPSETVPAQFLKVSTSHDGSTSNPTPHSKNDLFQNLKSVIFYGRFILIIPCSRKNANSYKRPSFRLKVIPYFATINLLLLTCVRLFVDIHLMVKQGDEGKLGILNYVLNFRFVADTLMVFFVYFHFLRNSDKFYKIFERWDELISVQPDIPKDPYLTPLAIILNLFILCFVTLHRIFLILETASSSLPQSPANVTGNDGGNVTGLENFYNKRMGELKDVLPYNIYFQSFILVLNIISVLAVTYISLLLICFSRALSFQFRKLIENSTGLTVEESDFARICKDLAFWKDVVRKYKSLTLILKTVNSFMSPLLFTWTAWNIYVLSTQLFSALVKTEFFERVSSHYILMDFLTQASRFLLSVISAAKVNTYAVKILKVLRNCPKEYYREAEVDRLELQVSTGHTIGLSGMGCFSFTKPILLSIFNVLFTLEIVLLQSTQLKLS